MPKRTVQFVKGYYYHIYNRGAGRQAIFRSDENYQYLLRLLKPVVNECQVSVIAYCLMPTHYHWLMRQDGDCPINQVPKRVFGSYSQAFNRMYDRSGTLFEDRFKVRLVNTDEYLRHLCRYIHGNPVKDGIALAPELWQYSNYLEWIGERPGTLVDRQFIQQFFPKVTQYKNFVLDDLRGRATVPAGVKAYLDSLWNDDCDLPSGKELHLPGR